MGGKPSALAGRRSRRSGVLGDAELPSSTGQDRATRGGWLPRPRGLQPALRHLHRLTRRKPSPLVLWDGHRGSARAEAPDLLGGHGAAVVGDRRSALGRPMAARRGWAPRVLPCRTEGLQSRAALAQGTQASTSNASGRSRAPDGRPPAQHGAAPAATAADGPVSAPGALPGRSGTLGSRLQLPGLRPPPTKLKAVDRRAWGGAPCA